MNIFTPQIAAGYAHLSLALRESGPSSNRLETQHAGESVFS